MADSLPKRGGMSLTTKIVIGMAAGLITGTILNIIGSAGVNSWLVDGLFAMIGTAFVNGLKMLVVPLVVFSLLCGVLGIGDIRMLGRVGGKSFALYIATTAIAIATAILLGLLIGPGEGFVMEGVDTSGVTAAEAPTVWQVFANIVPSNPVASLANGDMLQIIFYTIVVGIAALMLGEQSTGFAKACEYMNELMMKVVSIVMAFAPYGVFALIARVFAKEGIELFIPVLAYVMTLTGALFLHLFVTLMLILKLMSGLSPMTFIAKIRPAQIFAFSTASSNATIPITYRCTTDAWARTIPWPRSPCRWAPRSTWTAPPSCRAWPRCFWPMSMASIWALAAT